MEKIFIIGVILIGTFVSCVNTLQCYSCYNCPDSEVKEEHLVTCGATTTTTTAAPVSSSTTTGPVDPNTTTTTTAAPVNPSTTTTTTAESVNTSSTTTTTTTTTTPVNPSTTTTTTTTTAAPLDPENPVRNTIESIPPQAIRVRRHVQPNIVELDSGCICEGRQCACDEETEVLRESQYADATNETYVCSKGIIKVNGTDVIIRSCATPIIAEQEFCDFVIKNENATSCSTCTTDKCNNSFSLQHSVGVLLFVLTLVAFTK